MDWRWYHTLLVFGWVAVVTLGKVATGLPSGPAATAGFVVGVTVGALLVVWVLGSLWQFLARRLRGTDRSSR